MKKMLSSLVAMLLSVSLLTACGAAGSNAPGGGEADSVKVGVLAPLTGANAEFGKGFEVAMTMAMEEVNAAGWDQRQNAGAGFPGFQGRRQGKLRPLPPVCGQ